jgi:hypothetical protein
MVWPVAVCYRAVKDGLADLPGSIAKPPERYRRTSMLRPPVSLTTALMTLSVLAGSASGALCDPATTCTGSADPATPATELDCPPPGLRAAVPNSSIFPPAVTADRLAAEDLARRIQSEQSSQIPGCLLVGLPEPKQAELRLRIYPHRDDNPLGRVLTVAEIADIVLEYINYRRQLNLPPFDCREFAPTFERKE